jgi:hypothetical protein
MTVPTASSAPTPPMANPAGLGRVWPNPGIKAAGRLSMGCLGAWRDINGVPGPSKGPRPTPNSA